MEEKETEEKNEHFYFNNDEEINNFLEGLEEEINNYNFQELEYSEKNEIFQNNILGLTKKNTGVNRRITIKKKLQILNEAKANGRNKAALKYNLAESTLTYWKKEEYKLREITDKNKRITIHPRRKNIYPEIEEKLINFIEFNRKLLNHITT